MSKDNQYAYDLFISIKNTIGFHRAVHFMKWFHEKYPAMDPHHPFGSYGKLKTSDYCCIPVTRIQHTLEADNYEFAINNINMIFKIHIEYIQYLEDKLYGKD